MSESIAREVQLLNAVHSLSYASKGKVLIHLILHEHQLLLLTRQGELNAPRCFLNDNFITCVYKSLASGKIFEVGMMGGSKHGNIFHCNINEINKKAITFTLSPNEIDSFFNNSSEGHLQVREKVAFKLHDLVFRLLLNQRLPKANAIQSCTANQVLFGIMVNYPPEHRLAVPLAQQLLEDRVEELQHQILQLQNLQIPPTESSLPTIKQEALDDILC